MNSMTKNKKGLISLFALLITIAMLVTGTYAWFTDTATVKGNKVYAGMLTVDVVATVQEVLDAFAQSYFKKNYDGLSEEPPVDPKTDPEGGNLSEKEFVEKKFDALGLKVASPDSTSPEGNKGKIVKIDAAGAADTIAASNAMNDYCAVTNKVVPVMNVSNVEPGATYPVQMHVMNSGELAISYAAGFSIDNGASKTGLEVLEAQRTALGDEKYNYLAQKLAEKQLAKDSEGKDRTYTTTMAGVEGVDLGGHLEDVLEVYAMTEDEYGASQADSHSEAMPLLKTDRPAAAGVEAHTANYIGTISQIIHCNDAAYIMTLNEKVSDAATKVSDAALIMDQKIAAYELAVSNGAIGTTLAAVTEARDAAVATHAAVLAAYNKLYAEQQELPKVAGRLANSASGYCVPESKVSTAAITVYERDGNPRKIVNPADPTGPKIDQKVAADCIGTAYFAIHMPGSVDNFYQNAMLTLNAGITANQVELDADGIHVMVYDDATQRLH